MPENKKKKKYLPFYLLVIAAIIAADQGLKAWVHYSIPLNPLPEQTRPFLPGIVRLSHIHNSGAAFGMMQGMRIPFLILLAVFCAFVIWALAKGHLSLPWERWLAIIAVGGAISNGIDRAVHGYVEDMFELVFMNFAIFNLADFAINVSCIAFCLLILFGKDGKDKKEKTTAET